MNRLTLALLLLLCPTLSAEPLAIVGETVYTMAGAPIQNGVVLIRDGKIERVGAGLNVPAGYRVLNAKVVTPGLIDAHTVVGLAGYLNQAHDQDQIERSDAIQPELRAIDACLAFGAGLLYLTNLTAIVLAGGVVNALADAFDR